MSGAFAVDLVRLATLVDEIDRFGSALEEAMGHVDSRVRGLYPSWTGCAQQAHDAAHAHWQRGATEVRDGLITMRRIATTAHTNYSDAVAANQRMWQL